LGRSVRLSEPAPMAYVAAGFTGLWIVMKFVSALRD
jgi:hypothetical protein